ncbi:uncharacterized protein LOC112601721 [Melanaphis sacchari]|uniref:uncharacterized protein LOC112601721 n=1 Tax=Melanaphis sacchari TaxID=742174 RepID=UPI000DC13DD9|nr:uncharacterized protein LOC112601721 [Melanaphis sacchari]
MKHFHHYAVVFVFVIACNYIVHGIHINDIDLSNYHWESMSDVLTYDPKSYHIEDLEGVNDLYLRRKRGYFSMKIPFIESAEDSKKETVTDSTIATSDADTDTTISAVNTKIVETASDIGAAYRNFFNSAQSEMTYVLTIGPDVKRTMVEAAPYMPLVCKVAMYVIPNLSQRDLLMLSLNVAALTTQGINNYSSAECPTKSNVGATIAHYATGIYNKLKGAFESHFGDSSDNSAVEEKTKSSEETHSIFDTVKKHINYFGGFMSSYDEPETENNEDQIETIVTHIYNEDSQTPTTKTILTKAYENGVDLIHQATSDEADHVLLSNQILQIGENNVDKMINEMKNDYNSNSSSNESDEFDIDDENDDDIETYDYDDDNENMIDYDVKVNEEDFKEIMQESMSLQPDYVQTLDGEELLEKIDEIQTTLPNPHTNNGKIFEALIEELDIDQRFDYSLVNELIDDLNKITNFFISSGLKKNEELTTTPTSPMN